MSKLPTRRGFLALTGSGAAASLAGCSQLGLTDQSNGEAGDAVTLAVAPDEEAMASLEEEIQAEIDNGTLSEQEAQAEFQERQVELMNETMTTFEESAADSDVTVEESTPEYGLARATGSDEAIMSLLRNGEVSGIYPGEQYDQFIEQQRQREQQREQQQELIEQQQQAQEEGNETVDDDSGTDADAGNETDE